MGCLQSMGNTHRFRSRCVVAAEVPMRAATVASPAALTELFVVSRWSIDTRTVCAVGTVKVFCQPELRVVPALLRIGRVVMSPPGGFPSMSLSDPDEAKELFPPKMFCVKVNPRVSLSGRSKLSVRKGVVEMMSAVSSLVEYASFTATGTATAGTAKAARAMTQTSEVRRQVSIGDVGFVGVAQSRGFVTGFKGRIPRSVPGSCD